MMDGKEMQSLSKFISLILRHKPEAANITWMSKQIYLQCQG